MVVDTFLFNNEFEMLDIRLELSKGYVDKWIILESDKTWNNEHKPFNLKEKIYQYQEYNIELLSINIPNNLKLSHNRPRWYIENYSRSMLQLGIEKLSKSDIILHSDLDENLNPTIVPDLINFFQTNKQPVACKLDLFFYCFNLKANRSWEGTVLAQKHMFDNPHQLYRGENYKKKDRRHCRYFPGISGYHWTWIGDDTRIATKARSCIETYSRNADDIIKNFKEYKTEEAVNHKCKTEKINYPYPKEVLEIIGDYPYWA